MEKDNVYPNIEGTSKVILTAFGVPEKFHGLQIKRIRSLIALKVRSSLDAKNVSWLVNFSGTNKEALLQRRTKRKKSYGYSYSKWKVGIDFSARGMIGEDDDGKPLMAPLPCIMADHIPQHEGVPEFNFTAADIAAAMKEVESGDGKS